MTSAHSIGMPRFSRITGTGSHLPPRRLSNADLARELADKGIETSDDWIVARTGIRARHFAADGVECSDLAVAAANATRTNVARNVFIQSEITAFRSPDSPLVGKCAAAVVR